MGHRRVRLDQFTASVSETPLVKHAHQTPWWITSRLTELTSDLFAELGADYQQLSDGVLAHNSATIESGAILKPPVILGPNSFVAATAYLRGGIYLGDGCIVGPACELKTVIMLARSKIAHLSFVGDSIIGSRANIEAGAIIANYRNEMTDKRIRIAFKGTTLDTGVEKFGTMVGDDGKIGANAVIAPGTLLPANSIIRRGQNIDQFPDLLPDNQD